MASIFEICNELELLASEIEKGVDCHLENDPDSPPDRAEQALDDLVQRELATQELLKKKIDGYCNLVNEMESRSVQAQHEIGRLKRVANAHSSLAERLRSSLHYALVRLNLPKVETALHRVSLAKKAKSVEVDEFAQIPDEFLKTYTEVSKTAIRAALESGRELPFARWAPEGTSLRMK